MPNALKNWTAAARTAPSRSNNNTNYLKDWTIERLENRRMLAGNVTVDVDDGDLEVRGQNNTEQGIFIEATNVFGQYRIGGFASTTINDEAEILVNGVTGDFDIRMRSGAKTIVLTEGDQDVLRINGDLDVTTGGSNDIVLLDTVNVVGETTVRTRGGEDSIVMFGGEYLQRVDVNSGGGNDVFFTNSLRIEEELRVRTSGGNDYVIVSLTQVDGETDIRTGNGVDVIGIYYATLDEAFISGGGRADFLEDLGNDVGDLEIRNVEEDFTAGCIVMLSQARNENATFNSSIQLFANLGLGF